MLLNSLSSFHDKPCICGCKCDGSIIDTPRLARFDIFVFSKFDITALTVGFDMV